MSTNVRRVAVLAIIAASASLAGCADVIDILAEAKQRRQGNSADPAADSSTVAPVATTSSSSTMTGAAPVAIAPPPGPVALGPEQIELAPYANVTFERFEGLPSGDRNLDGVDFRIGERFLAVRGSGHFEYPHEILGIAISRPVQTMHFLQAGMGGGFGRPGMPYGPGDPMPTGDGQDVGEYIVRYEDGDTVRIPLVYGQNLRDWWNWDGNAPTPGAQLAWTGTHPQAQVSGVNVRLYKFSWTNPNPGKKIREFDFRSSGGRSAPFLLAVTVDGGMTSVPAPSTPAPPPVTIASSDVSMPPSNSYASATPVASSPARTVRDGWEFPLAERPAGTTDAARNGERTTSTFTLPPPGPLDAAAWNRAKESLIASRQRTIGAAADAYSLKLADAKVKATLDSREADAAQLEADAAAVRIDPLKLPKSKDGKLSAAQYVSDRIKLEREALAAYQTLEARAPTALPATDRQSLEKEVGALESALAKLTLSERLLAPSLAASRQATRVAQPSDEDGRFLAPAPVHWDVVVDKPESPTKITTANISGRRLENVLPEHAYYPPGPPSFMFIATGTQNVSGVEIYELRTLQAAGLRDSLTGIPERPMLNRFSEFMTISNDMSRLALFVPDEHKLVSIDMRKRRPTLIDWEGEKPFLMFLPDDRLMVLDRGAEPSVQALELPGGDVLSKSTLIHPPSDDPGLVTTSPGGRYLVVTDGKKTPAAARFFDLKEGRHAGSLELSGGGMTAHFRCFAFSNDGTEFAAYMATTDGRHAMVVFDVATGRPTYVRRVDRANEIDISVASDHALQWFPDGKGWLLLQRYVIDRERAGISQKIEGYFDPVYRQNGAKILSDRYVLSADGQHAMSVIEVARNAPAQ